ncbi:MAG: TRAP transporter large permease [Syntrophales bacterium]|nr:TRAP transporter large permease [Syntrophales bacterium]
MELILFLISFLLFLLLGIPIALTLGAASLIYILVQKEISLTLLTQTTFAGIASFPLLAIPLFILSGHLMHAGGLTEDLVRFSKVILGHIRGGLGLATILASAVFAAISGSAVATAVAIGTVMIPAMKKQGYDEELSAGVTATASCMGPLIPPSIPFIIYGIITNVSIASLFVAGVLPGLLLGASLMLYMILVARTRGYPRHERATIKEIINVTSQSLPSLAMPVVIVGGIIAGIFTPTEAAGVAVTLALITGFLIHRRLRLKQLPSIILKSGVESSVVLILLGLSEPFAWIVAVEQLPSKITELIVPYSSNPYVFLVLVNIVLLLIGVPIETAPALVIMAPMLAPIAEKMGIDPLHFGVVVCFNLVLGLITPPVGAVLFSICGISGLSLERLTRGISIPFLIAVGVLLTVTFLPPLSTALPNLIFKR